VNKTDTLKVEQNEDGSFSLEWDPEDPLWSWLNTMTEEEITKIITDYAEQVINDSLISDDSLNPDADL
jgi:hypothetical protein|tara:strand:- start:1942 stop:2145 length:204 start_codon:yes stop_codon:yes gene_type:complete